ncbi:MAG TPA: amidohydrolase family protein [Pyrinomonadaceae bacterium]|jgi:imidazolonepropionase-like amidohydrolase|nr:amidohydrolase family protein [Pyrinomonadaceae bacterium]
MRKRFALLLALFCACSLARAQERPVAFRGATIITVSGPPVQNGVLVVHRGKIVSVGASASIPEGAEVVDATGKVIMPGLVDTHSHIGGGSGGDNSVPIQPDVRVLDSINVRDASLMRARAGGITTVNVMPGSSLLSSGQTVYLKLRRGGVIDELLLRDARGEIAGGLKMANGTNPLRPNSSGPFPGTRSKSAALVREQFTRAQEYREKVRRAGSDKSKLPPRDLALEALSEVLDGRRVVHFHTHRHDDILTAVRLSKEFGFRVVLHHVSEAWKVAEELGRARVPASIIMIEAPGGKLEAMDVSLTNGAALERAGVLTAIHTDDYITDSRYLLRQAALAVRAGMSREAALRSLTIAGAEMLDMKDRVGTLEAGKDADFVVLSGDPLSVYAKVLETWVEGVRVFDRANPADKLFATGGYGAGRDQKLDYECYEEAEGGSNR